MIAQMAASRSVLNDYVALMKPRIISLLVLTALGAMFVAAEGAPDPTVVVLVLVGGSLAAGGAHADLEIESVNVIVLSRTNA